MFKKLREKLEEILSKGRKDLDDEEIGQAREKLDEEGTQGFRKNAELLIDMVEDIIRKKFKASTETIIALIAAVVYFVWVLDLVPDLVPIAGYVDDAIVIATTLKICMEDVRRYRKWRTKKTGWAENNPLSRMFRILREKVKAFRDGWGED